MPAARRSRARREARPGRHPRRRVLRPAAPARARARRRGAPRARARSPRSTQLGPGRLRRPRRRRRARRLVPVPPPGRARAAARGRAADAHGARGPRPSAAAWPACSATGATPAAGPTEAVRPRRWPATGARCARSTSGCGSGRCSPRCPGLGPLGEVAAAERLAAFGFADVERTRQAVAELTRGPHPLVADDAAAPAAAARLAVGLARSRPRPARAASPGVGRAALDGAGHRVPRLAGGGAPPRPPARHEPPARRRPRRQPRPHRAAARPRAPAHQAVGRPRGQRAERHLVAGGRATSGSARCSAGSSVTSSASPPATCSATPPSTQVGADLTAARRGQPSRPRSRSLDPQVPFAVVAFGRLGGAELGYASDLDVAFVHEGSDVAEAERVASGLAAVRRAATRRPSASGRSTPTSGPRDAAVRWPAASRAGTGYLERWASTWERQAYLRVRRVAGDAELGRRLVDRIHDGRVGAARSTADDEREVRRMKVRIEQERLAPGEDPEFHLKLGRGSLSDIEFTVQLLQLRHRRAGARRRSAALDALVEGGHLPSDEADVLEEAYRFCERHPEPQRPRRGRGRLAADPSRAGHPAGPLARRSRSPSSGRSTGGSPAGPAASWSGASTTSADRVAP